MRTKFSTSVLVAAIVVLVLSDGQSTHSRPLLRITGTYTDMHFIEEAGDVLGHELKIVFTGGRFQGALQIAEGAPGELVLVDIHSDGARIDFSIPDSSPSAGTFTGAVEN